jgi:AAA domain
MNAERPLAEPLEQRVSWEPLNLAHLEERPRLEPTLGGLGLVYPGKRHVFSGPQESAKTLAAYAIALAVIRKGGTVALLDFEMGQWDARDRLRELGARDPDLERLLYIEPETPASPGNIATLIDLNPALVVIDAAAGAYSLEGLDDNKRVDVERFTETYVRPFWLLEIATILVDHVVKNAEARGKYAIGSERKVGSADVHLGFDMVSPLVRGGTGLYKVTTHKDRLGHLPRPRAADFELRSDPVTHAIAWTFSAPKEDESIFWPTALMQRVSRYLEEEGRPVSRNAIEGAVAGKRDYVRLAIDRLVDEGFASESGGANRARLFASKQPFREDEFAPGSPRLNGDEFAPGSPLEESLNDADFSGSPQFAPSSPLALGDEFAPDRTRLQGGANRRCEVGDVGEDEVERLAALAHETLEDAR